jgi:hypothetical protein
MRLSVNDLTKGLMFHGEVSGKRQHYYILSTRRNYFIMSLSRSKRAAGQFNLVDKEAVEQLYLYHRLRGQRGLTTPTVFRRSKNRRRLCSSLGVLNILYVLVATRRAHIDERHASSSALFFNIRA